MNTTEVTHEAPTLETVGSVVALWHYPVKSMQGEELNAAQLTLRGVLGDRAYALIDPSNSKVASAKNPRKWGRLFDFRAAFAEPVMPGERLPPVRITLPDGAVVMSDQTEVDRLVSAVLGREVALATTPPQAPELEEYWPDIEGLAHREAITDEAMPPGTFFDAATVHLLTTAAIDRLRALYPDGRFEVRRFRPNIVIEPVSGEPSFMEDDWVGRTLALGDEVRLRVIRPCPRCVMTTLPQADLPRDPGILRTAAQHHEANIGVYASVVRGGTLRRDDPVRLL